MLHSICQQIWKTQQWPQDWKWSVFIPNPKKDNAQNVQTSAQLHTSHTLAKWCSKFSKPDFNSMWTVNFQMFKLDLERQRSQRSNFQHLLDHWESKRVPEKHLLLLYWLRQSLWRGHRQTMCGSQQTMENSSRDGSTRPSGLPPEKSVCRSRSNR